MGAVIVEVFAFLHPVHEEVVERTVGHKLQCAERVCHAFEEVALPVGKVVHRISLPSGARAMVRMLHYTVDDRVAEVHVGACHVYLGAEHHGTFLNLAAVHFLEQVQCFFDRTVAVGTFHTGLGGSSFLGGNLLGSLFVDVCLALFDEADSEVPQLLEIVGSVIFVTPFVAQPLDVFLDGFYIFHIFFGGIGVIETQVADTAVCGGNTEIKADGLGVSDVEVTVWFGREACLYFSPVFTLFQIVFYYLLNEVQALFFACFFALYFCHNVTIFVSWGQR